jgi:hypothetical protein
VEDGFEQVNNGINGLLRAISDCIALVRCGERSRLPVNAFDRDIRYACWTEQDFPNHLPLRKA